ncbi:MAG: dTDP-4-amino-4,6-dideoxygalactose transaminase [Bacteroidetes bacterium]|nr:dTDP-4-amino-4,6-dideoxygalactose transaminase [Bacteroidota bacterium]
MASKYLTENNFIPFNKPAVVGRELEYIRKAVEAGNISGNGPYAQSAADFFTKRYGLRSALITDSCTSALEMSALLLNIRPGDEVIMPSYSFVSTANAFVLMGAKIIFADSTKDHPNMNVAAVEQLITPRTRALVCVHYAGVPCDPAQLKMICEKNNIHFIEDAAHAIDVKCDGKYLGTFGDLGTISFHETKNVIAGKGGLLCVNDASLVERAQEIYENGTNRRSFLSGKVNRYEWTSLGSSFSLSDLNAAFLCGQLECIDVVNKKRISNWKNYYDRLHDALVKKGIGVCEIEKGTDHNGHIFFLVCRSQEERDALIRDCAAQNIHLVFHYQSLHKSPFFRNRHDGRKLVNADRFSDCLVRLPLFHELTEEQLSRVCEKVLEFYSEK